jgi:preprotein translocase subunit SecE
MIKFMTVKAAIQFLQETRLELSKVVWPKREEVTKLTLIVLVISGIIGAYVGLLDLTFTKLLELFVSI